MKRSLEITIVANSGQLTSNFTTKLKVTNAKSLSNIKVTKIKEIEKCFCDQFGTINTIDKTPNKNTFQVFIARFIPAPNSIQIE